MTRPPQDAREHAHANGHPRDAAEAAPATGGRPSAQDRIDAKGRADKRLLPEDSPYQARLQAVKAAAHPLLEAAMPLLRALADMPRALDAEAAYLLRRLLDREVLRLHSLCGDALIRHEHCVAASYALCTALDEAAATTDWGKGGVGDVGLWSADQLAVRFHGDNKGGDKVFLLLGRLSASPAQHIDLIEVLYAILGLGFEGRYAAGGAGGSNDARRQLDTVRHRLFGLLADARGEVPVLLSPHGRGSGSAGGTGDAPGFFRRRPAVFRPLKTLPLGWTCALYVCVLTGLFVWHKTALDRRTAAVLAGIHAVGALHSTAAARPVEPMRLKALLHDEIERGRVSVEENAEQSTVSFHGDGMFAAGSARLSAGSLPSIAVLAQELQRSPGVVQVNGHTDDLPIRTREFPDNQRLSRQRAQAVAEALQAGGLDAARLKVEGLGDTRPVADNRTVAGRALNRRVDVVLVSD